MTRDHDISPRPIKRQRRNSSRSDENRRPDSDRATAKEKDQYRHRDSRSRDDYGGHRDRRRRSESPRHGEDDYVKGGQRYRSRERGHRDDTARKDRNRRRSRSRSSSRSRSRSKPRSQHRSHRHRHEEEYDPEKRRRRRGGDHSPKPKSSRHDDQNQIQVYERSKKPLPSQKDAFSTTNTPSSALDRPLEKQKPNFGLSGKLAAASNTVQTGGQTIVLKYHEPPEARKPAARDQWRLYVFKDGEIVETVELSEQSCWLFGREAAIADFPIEHPSCSKQHAVIQFRYVDRKNEFGDQIGKVKPYVIDLESANGTSVNGELVPVAQYVELRDKDEIQFGHSSREYMIQLPPRS